MLRERIFLCFGIFEHPVFCYLFFLSTRKKRNNIQKGEREERERDKTRLLLVL